MFVQIEKYYGIKTWLDNLIEGPLTTKSYFLNEECTILHRKDGPALECGHGCCSWWENGKLHRADGPAVVENGEDNKTHKEWWINGIIHREDGPAVEYSNGEKSYFLNGTHYKEEEYWAIIKFGAFA